MSTPRKGGKAYTQRIVAKLTRVKAEVRAQGKLIKQLQAKVAEDQETISDLRDLLGASRDLLEALLGVSREDREASPD